MMLQECPQSKAERGERLGRAGGVFANSRAMENISATQMIRDDHKKIRGLFTQLTAVDLRAHEMVSGVSEELFTELDVHARLEEEILFPALENVVSFNGGAVLEKGREDNEQIRRLILQIRSNGTGGDGLSSNYVNQILELRDTFEQHASDVENTILGQAEQVIGADLMSLGERMRERRLEMMQATSFHPERAEHVQNPNSGEQMRKGA